MAAQCPGTHCARVVPLPRSLKDDDDSIVSELSTSPISAQGFAIDVTATQVHIRDAPGVRDLVERVGIEDDEVGALAAGDRSELIELEDFC